ncbi:hypothetical protein EDD86DRAFT_273027 [Gorgonomyces haynaldii]|nr:hypothetical protein EDD86DRAFT_273027 [Gorgonomyces haynaldii]
MDFASAFRKSAFASLPKHQVIKRTGSGEWGLKHTMRNNYKNLVVQQLDDPVIKYAQVKSGTLRAQAVSVWKEVMPPVNTNRDVFLNAFENDEAPVPMKPLETLTNQEWKQWVDYAREKRQSFQEKLQQSNFYEYEWQSHLGLDKIKIGKRPVHPITYTPQAETKEVKLKGRILGTTPSRRGFLVGVQGFVAHLPKENIASHYTELNQGRNIDLEKVYDFYVSDVSFDVNGKPNIKLSLFSPNQQQFMNTDNKIEGLEKNQRRIEQLKLSTQQKFKSTPASTQELLNMLSKLGKK